MKKRFFGLCFLFLCIIGLLTGCSGMGFKVTGVTGVSSPIIDPVHKNISFQVLNEKDSFDFDDILYTTSNSGDFLSVTGYYDEELLDEVELGIAKLEVGLNSFYVKFAIQGKSAIWSLSINRLPIKKPITKMEIKECTKEYHKGDDYIPGLLYVEYNDQTFEDITISRDMITGFDTKRLGEKNITVEFMDRSISYTITVLPEEGSELTSIELLSLKTKEYYMQQEFAGGTLRLKYGRDIMDIAITKDMLTGFNTSYSGNYTATISYEGKSIAFDYIVLNERENVSLYSFNSQYQLNEEFKGGSLKIKRGSSYEFIDITKDMLTGFDTSYTGTRQVYINYGSFGCYQSIDVIDKITTEPNISRGYCSEYYTTRLMSTIKVLSRIDRSDFTDYDFEIAINNITIDKNSYSEFQALIEEAGLNDSKIQEVISFLRYDLSEAIKLHKRVLENNGRLNVINYDDINKVKNICKSAATLLTIEQYAKLIPENIKEEINNNSYNLFDNDTKKVIEMTLEGIIKRINDSEVEAYLNKKLSRKLSYIDRAYLVAYMRNMLITVANLDTSTIYNLISNDRDNLINNLDNYKYTINKLGDELAKIIGNTDTYLLRSFLINYALAKNEYKISNDLLNEFIPEFIDKLSYYSMDLAKLISTLDEESLRSVSSFIRLYKKENLDKTSKEELVYASIKLARVLEPLANKLKDNNDANLIDMLYYGTNSHNTLGNMVLDEINSLVHTKPTGLTVATINRIYTRLQGLFSYKEANTEIAGDDIVIEAGSSVSSFIESFNSHNSIMDNDNNMILNLSIDMLVDKDKLEEDLKVPGLHTTKININGAVYKINFVALSQEFTLEPLPVYNEPAIFYINTNGEILKIKHLKGGYEMSLDDYIGSLKLPFNVDDIALSLSLPYNRFDNKLSFIHTNTNDGINIGALVIKNEIGSYYLPNNYAVIDDNVAINYDNSQIYYIIGSGINNLRYDIDYGYDYLNPILNQEALDNIHEGDNYINYSYNGKTITLKVIGVLEENSYDALKITNVVGKCYLDNSNTLNNLTISYLTPRGVKTLGYADFKREIEAYYYKKNQFSSVSIYLNPNYNDTKHATLVVDIYENKYVHLTHEVDLMTEEEYREINVVYDSKLFNKEVSDIAFDSYKSYTDYALQKELSDRLHEFKDSILVSSDAYSSYNHEGLLSWLSNNYIGYSYKIDRNDNYIDISIVVNNKPIISYKIVKESYNREESKIRKMGSLSKSYNRVYVTKSDLINNTFFDKLISDQLYLSLDYKLTSYKMTCLELLDYLSKHNYKFSILNLNEYQDGYIEGLITLDNKEEISVYLNAYFDNPEVIEIEKPIYYYHNYNNIGLADLFKKNYISLYGIDIDGNGSMSSEIASNPVEGEYAYITYTIYDISYRYKFRLERIYNTPSELKLLAPADLNVMTASEEVLKSYLVAYNEGGAVLDIDLGLYLSSYRLEAHKDSISFYDAYGNKRYELML